MLMTSFYHCYGDANDRLKSDRITILAHVLRHLGGEPENCAQLLFDTINFNFMLLKFSEPFRISNLILGRQN